MKPVAARLQYSPVRRFPPFARNLRLLYSPTQKGNAKTPPQHKLRWCPKEEKKEEKN